MPKNLTKATAIVAGPSHTCVLTPGVQNEIICWGYNLYGQILPSVDLGVTIALATGEQLTCGVDDTGDGTCWGRWVQNDLPMGLGALRTVATGTDFGCGVKTTGYVECWGSPDYGQTAVPADLDIVVSLSSAGHHSCAITTSSAPGE